MALRSHLIALFFGTLCAHCSSQTCGTMERYFDGGTLTTPTNGALAPWYETSPVDGPYLPFEGGTLLHITNPFCDGDAVDVAVYLSFSQYPLDAGGGGYAFIAGNQGLVVTQDANEVAIRNDSCANYYARVVITYKGSATDAGGCDASP